MRIVVAIFSILFLSSFTYSQPESKYGVVQSVCNWDNMSLNKNYIPAKDDSLIFVVSTRNYSDTAKEFLDDEYDATAKLKYFIVYFNTNKWVAVPYSSLEKMLDLKPNFKNLVIFTEGLGKTYTKGVDRATRLTREYNTDVIFFDWPTERANTEPGKNIKLTYALSEKIALPYSAFLEEFQTYKDNQNSKFQSTTLLFHSMGNLILMHDLQKNLFKNIHPNLFDNVILNAACVPQKDHNVWLSKLNISKHIYVTINDKDRNLNGAKLLFFAHQLGEKPKKPFLKNVHYINFSEVLHKEHNYFLMQPLLTEKPYLRNFYDAIFNGQIPQLKFADTTISEEVRKYLPGQGDNSITPGM